MQSACAILYFNLWAAWLYHILPHYLITCVIFGENVLNIKRVFFFFLQLVSETDRLCGLVVRVSGYRYRGPGFDPRRYQIF